MTFEAGQYKIEISENVVGIFTRFKQIKRNAPESGGIVLGQVKGTYIYVSKATTPSIIDVSSRFNFLRERNVAQLIVDYEFYNSNGHIIYLGEWHTHSEESPSPSSQDYKMIKQQYRKNTLNENYILMFIVGIKTIYMEMYDGKTSVKGTLVER